MIFRQYCHVGNTAQHCRLGLFQGSDFAGDLWSLEIKPGRSLMYLRKRNIFSPSVWMCTETNVTIPQFYRVWNHSLDAGLRMDGLLLLDLRDMAIVVLRSTSNAERLIRPAQGDLCGTGDHSINKNKSRTPTAKRKRATVKCGLLTHQHTFFSRRVSVEQFWFEDNEAVMKMTVKGRSPTMRHVSRTHRVALDWLFDRINLEPKIQIKHVDTKNQLADMLTKESFTRDEWNRLLRLFNIVSFSMFSCSHWCNFLSDPIGKHSAMSERGQEATSSEGSPMAKPKPVNLVLRSLWSAMENPPQDLGYPVNPGNVDEGQGDQTSARRLVRTTQSPDIECSQVRRQGNAQNSDSWKQADQEESSNSTGARRLVRAATPRTEFQNMKYTNHQHMTKVFHFLQKNLEITAGYSTCSMEASKTTCVEMENDHVFVIDSSHSSLDRIIWRTWRSTRTRTSRKFGAHSTSHRIWCWSILKKFWMCIRLKVHLPHGRYQCCLMSKWSTGQEQKKVSVYSDSVLCLEKMNDSKDALTRWEKVKWKNSKCPLL